MNTSGLKSVVVMELNLATSERDLKNFKAMWVHLERAHIASQPFWDLHFRVHVEMARSSLSQKDILELTLQVPRLLLAAPSSLLKLAPKGNPGSGKYGIFKKCELPDDLKKYF